MAKFPGVPDLGPTPSADPTRPVGSADASGVARGGAALSEGVRQLGAGERQLGEGTGELALDMDRWDFAKAHSYLLTNLANRDAVTAADTAYGPDDTGKSLPDRHADAVTTIQQQAAAMVRDPRMRERFTAETMPVLQRSIERASTHATSLENTADIAWATEQGNTLMDQAVHAPDDETRTQLIDSHNELIDGLVARGALNPLQAVQAKQTWAHQYATADALARADSDPQGVINELRAAPGSPADITGRILKVEGEGKNPRSSATGPGQFLDTTWLDVLKRNRPDLADGRSDPDLLALRADRPLARQMTEALRAENETGLRARGIDPTPGAQYLAHFLGLGGATAVLQGDPNRPVADVLAEKLGPAKAAAVIQANPEVLGGKLTGSVTAWADQKMGGATPGNGSIYDLLRPDMREQLLAHAQAALDKRNATDLSDFKGRVDDTTAEAMRTGTVSKPMTQADFIGRLGVELGLKAFTQYQANVQLGRDVNAVKTLDPGEQAALLKSYEPQPGDANYADRAKRHDALASAIAQSNKERTADPAAYAVQRLPATQEAYQAFVKTAADPQATDDQRQAMARDYATKTLMEQDRIGIPRDAQRVVPQSYADTLSHALAAAASSDDPQKRVGLIAQVQREATLWGDNWPAVMRQVAPDAQPLVRAIAAGADPTAMTRLLSLGKDEKPAQVLKEQNDTKFKELTTSLNDALAPFRRTLVGRQMDRDYGAYYGLAEKLGALYVRDGKSATDAASAAFNDLVGKRYDFRDTWRLPKSSGVAADDVQAGTVAARTLIANSATETGGNPLRLAPALDDMGLRDANRADSFTKFARDGVFVTAPDNSGLNLVYGDKAVRTQDGKPLLLPWADLARRGGTPDARAKATRDATFASEQTP